MNMRDGLLAERKKVPSVSFSTQSIRQQDQFDAWCEFTSSMCDLEAINPPAEGFRASADSYHLGGLQLTSFQLSPMNFRYTKDMVRRSGFDHWCISALTQGPVGYESRGAEFKVPAGKLMLHSYASPFSGVMAETNYSGIFFSRDDFWDIADDLDKAAHRLVQGPMSSILKDFLVVLANRADGLTMAEASAVGDAFGHLMRAMIINTPNSLEAAKAPISAVQFDRARQYVNANLKSTDLTPDSICVNVGISRRQLYYLFEQQGGVARYIRNRRLAACYTALAKTAGGKSVSAIAYEYGFTNASSFYKQFQARYGFGPSEARSAARSGHTLPDEAGSTFVEWLLRVDPN